MTLTLLYFAAVRDLVGKDEERVAIPPEVRTVGELASYLPRLHPSLEGRLASVRLARNEVFADASEALGDGDVVALIPPVAGG
jgi:molybdopterin converting factor subunit 1